MGFGWGSVLRVVGGAAVDVLITGACTALIPGAGLIVGKVIGGAVDGYINGDRSMQQLGIDGVIGGILPGSGSFLKGGIKNLGTKAADYASENLISQAAYKTGLKGLPTYLRSLGKDGLIGQAVKGAAGVDLKIGVGDGLKMFTDPTGSRTSGGTNGTPATGGSTPLQWYPGTTSQIPNIVNPGVGGTQTLLLQPQKADPTLGSVVGQAYTSFGQLIDAGWQSTGKVKPGADAKSVFPEASV